MVDSLVRSRRRLQKEHALESERSGGEAQIVCGGVVVGELDDDRTVCPAWNLASGGIPDVGSVSARRLGGTGGTQSCASPPSQSNLARTRAADCGVAARAHALGATQAEGGAGTPAAGCELASGEHDG